MNNEGTLISEPVPNHTPPTLAGNDKVKLDMFYAKYGVQNGTAEEKIEALKKEIQARSFFALGGEETAEMELRANERIYLLKHGAK